MSWGAAMNESGPLTAIETGKEVDPLKCQDFLGNDETILFLPSKLGFNHQNVEFVRICFQNGGHSNMFLAAVKLMINTAVKSIYKFCEGPKCQAKNTVTYVNCSPLVGRLSTKFKVVLPHVPQYNPCFVVLLGMMLRSNVLCQCLRTLIWVATLVGLMHWITPKHLPFELPFSNLRILHWTPNPPHATMPLNKKDNTDCLRSLLIVYFVVACFFGPPSTKTYKT